MSASRTRTRLSATDRLTLIQTLNALPQPQFNELVFALDVPNANVPSHSACQGDRTTALLKWAKSPVGPGLPELEKILGKVIGKASQTAEEYLSFAIAGKLGDMSPDELQAIVELLRKKTGDYSIEIAFSREGSIKLILSGSSKGLNKLQELFESGELEDLETPPVEDVQSVNNNTTDARKARLVQALKLQKDPRLVPLASDRVSDLNHASDLNLALDRTLSSAFASAFVSDLNLVSDLASARDRALNLVSDLNHARDLDLILNLISTLDRARKRANDFALARALDFALVCARDFAKKLDLDFNFNLRNADLSGANLRNIDLSGADLSRTNLTDADVTGTIFGDNKGLTEADERDLERRGAIFQDSPSSDVSSLMLE